MDKQFSYAPRAQTLTKNPITTTTTATTTAITTQSTTGKKSLNTRRYYERFDKGSLSNKIVEKSLMHRNGGKRKTITGFITFKE